MSVSAAIANARLTRDGREWRDKRDLQQPALRLTHVALFAPGARGQQFATNRHE
jgi:hypothetical protein